MVGRGLLVKWVLFGGEIGFWGFLKGGVRGIVERRVWGFIYIYIVCVYRYGFTYEDIYIDM